MTAWANNIQQEWTQNREEDLVTGVLSWDLTAAFEMLDPLILCRKLELFGCDKIFNLHYINHKLACSHLSLQKPSSLRYLMK